MERRRSCIKKRKVRRSVYIARRIAALILFALLIWGISALCGKIISAVREKDGPEGQVQPDPPKNTVSYVVDPYRNTDSDIIAGYIKKLEEIHPDLISSFSIGKSAEGRDIMGIRLGRGDTEIIMTGSTHACEYFTSDYLMYVIDRYAVGYFEDERVGDVSYRDILDKVTFLIIPMVNPDGVNIALHGPDAAKDPDKIKSMTLADGGYDEWKSNANGVDINRNFPYNWNPEYASEDKPASKYYPGPYPASEPETQAVMAFFEKTDYALHIDFHIHGEVIFWKDNGEFRRQDLLEPLIEELYKVTGYEDAGEIDVEEFGGFLENYACNTFHKPGFTLELATNVPYDASGFDSAVNDGVYRTPLIAAKWILENRDRLSETE